MPGKKLSEPAIAYRCAESLHDIEVGAAVAFNHQWSVIGNRDIPAYQHAIGE
jgi:hypothetical protein